MDTRCYSVIKYSVENFVLNLIQITCPKWPTQIFVLNLTGYACVGKKYEFNIE